MKLRAPSVALGLLSCTCTLAFAEPIPLSLAQSVPLAEGAPLPVAAESFAAQSGKAHLAEAAIAAVAPTPVLLAAVGAAQPPIGSPVPEPSSLVLLATGALGLLETHRRRRSQS